MESQIRSDITNIIQSIAKVEHLKLLDESTVNEIKGWDSMKQVLMIVEIEKKYGIKFTSKEVLSLKIHKELEDLVEKKLKSQ